MSAIPAVSALSEVPEVSSASTTAEAPKSAAPTSSSGVDSLLYSELLQFYAVQFAAIDSGDAVAWENSFTPDGVFSSNALPREGHGRKVIREGAQAGIDDRNERGIVRRHVLTNLAVVRLSADSVSARSYVLVIETPRGGASQLYTSTTCEDTLVRSDVGWLVARRRVELDSLS